jgi:hypothetical protein
MADRISLSKDWYKRGEQLLQEYELKQEPRVLFESYIYLWIALTVAAKEYCASNGADFGNYDGQKTTDKEEILYWAVKCRQNPIMSMLKKNIEIVLDLCERNGSGNNEPIMDTNSEKVLNYHQQFISYWNGDAK